MVPTRSTRPIRALRPGLAKKAVMICLYSTTMTSAHSTKNTSIRTRKIRGEDSLVSSISIAERAEGPEGMALSVARDRFWGLNMAQPGREKRPVTPGRDGKRELRRETRLRGIAYLRNILCVRRLTGFLHDRCGSRSAGRDRGVAIAPDGNRLGGAAANRQFRLGR